MVFKCYVFVSRQIFHLQYCLKDLKQVAIAGFLLVL